MLQILATHCEGKHPYWTTEHAISRQNLWIDRLKESIFIGVLTSVLVSMVQNLYIAEICQSFPRRKQLQKTLYFTTKFATLREHYHSFSYTTAAIPKLFKRTSSLIHCFHNTGCAASKYAPKDNISVSHTTPDVSKVSANTFFLNGQTQRKWFSPTFLQLCNRSSLQVRF